MKIEPIITKAKDGHANGWLLPIWSSALSDYRPEQVYMTVVSPGEMKGPHLHMARAGRFLCIKGNVLIVTRQWNTYTEHSTGEKGYNVVDVPPGMAAAIYNLSDSEAFVLNMPTPCWTAENPDDHPVVDWEYKP